MPGVMANPSDCNAPWLHVNTQKDADLLSLCTRIGGYVFVGVGFEGDLNLDGLEEIGGMKVLNNNKLKKISSTSIQKLESISIVNSSSITSVEFPQLSSVQNIEVSDCKELQSFSILSTLRLWRLSFVNTKVKDLDLDVWSLDDAEISDNRHLRHLKLSSQHVTGSLRVTRNSRNLFLTLHNLEDILADLVYKDENVLAGTMNFVPQFLRFPSLSSVGNVHITSNNPYEGLLFNSLRSVGGTIQIRGPIENVAFPALKRAGRTKIDGSIRNIWLEEPVIFNDGFCLQSTDERLNCSIPDILKAKSYIHGVYKCESGGSVSELSDLSEVNSHWWPSRTVGKAFIALISSCFLLVLILGLMKVHMTKRKAEKSKSMGSQTNCDLEQASLMVNQHRTSELQAERETRELYDQHGLSELVEDLGTTESLDSPDIY